MKLKKFLVKIVVCLVMIFSLGACRAPEDICGTYNLVSMSGIPGVTVSTYEYNRITLEENYEFEIKNKAYGVVTKQTGEWDINKDKDEITFVTKQGSRELEETYEYNYDEKQIIMESYLEGYHIVMIFQLED